MNHLHFLTKRIFFEITRVRFVRQIRVGGNMYLTNVKKGRGVGVGSYLGKSRGGLRGRRFSV